MEDHHSIQSECTTSTSDLCYSCPCGKEYKSYPALFTHIKNKHNGKAPGSIKKPSLPSKRRGRPPTNRPNKCQPESSLAKPETDSSQFMTLQSISQIQREVTSAACIEAIAKTILSLPSEVLNKAHLNEMAAFIQMNVFLARQPASEFTLNIGSVLKEFLLELSSSVCWSHFEQVYSLLMLLVQFVLNQQNNGDIITNGPIDLLCDYINPFLQNEVLVMAAEFQIGEMGIFKAESMLDIFDAFFQWIMVKRYTNYRIKLNGNFKKTDPVSQ